jgi:hypothetical protein
MGGGRNGGVDAPLTARNERTRGASGSRRLCMQGRARARARSASNEGVAVAWGAARSIAVGGCGAAGSASLPGRGRHATRGPGRHGAAHLGVREGEQGKERE